MNTRGEVNILMLGGAKRVAMARMLRRAADTRGLQCRLYSYELTEKVPVACEAEIVIGGRWDDPALEEKMARDCERLDIDVVLPFVDGAVAPAARLAAAGRVFVPSCSATTAEAMFDKAVSARLFEQNGLPVPATWHGGPVAGPLIAKPRHGSASKGLIMIDSEEDLLKIGNTDDYLIQERIDNRVEYTVDCYMSCLSDGFIPAAVPRRRLEVTGGEVSRTVTEDMPEVRRLALQALRTLDLRGACTVQVIRDIDSGRCMIMEINPRLGGGVVCSVHAGADIPGLILDEARGIPATTEADWHPGVEIARYMQEVVFYNNMA